MKENSDEGGWRCRETSPEVKKEGLGIKGNDTGKCSGLKWERKANTHLSCALYS